MSVQLNAQVERDTGMYSSREFDRSLEFELMVQRNDEQWVLRME